MTRVAFSRAVSRIAITELDGPKSSCPFCRVEVRSCNAACLPLANIPPMPLTVVRILPIVTRGAGCVIQLGEVLFSDGSRARFRVSSVDPTDVRLIDGGCLGHYQRALTEWWAEHRTGVGR